jgi:putative phosphoribosyl transferase
MNLLMPESVVVPHALRITVGDGVLLAADLNLPARPTGVVLFAHGSGSSRFSPRNRQVAKVLNEVGLATVLADLLTPAEEAADARGSQHRFDVALLADRLAAVAEYLAVLQSTGPLPLGLFGTSTGAAAALLTAVRESLHVKAVVARGGRPDLAGEGLEHVHAPTLLIVGGDDQPVVELNRRALMMLTCEKQMVIVPGATHLFEEPGALDAVAALARDWFTRCLPPPS